MLQPQGGPEDRERAEPPDQLDQQMTADEEDKELQEEVERSPPTLKHNILYQQSETVKADYKTYKKPATASSESTADNRTGHKGGRPQLQNLPSSQKSASHCESPFKRHGLPPHNDHLTSAELSPYGLQTTQRCLRKDC
ncbi:hypothetical protein G5714_024666 [Onychostoma macrolepis]|uniref:Uncharacterized protein n=1 Tax=Onychostoma macrolepis TaxID=369639 RepID=A0A7J6BLS7_9TELE|nr:hypothetical protein G5714_024666 [Onychostoma macrolepis]